MMKKLVIAASLAAGLSSAAALSVAGTSETVPGWSIFGPVHGSGWSIFGPVHGSGWEIDTPYGSAGSKGSSVTTPWGSAHSGGWSIFGPVHGSGWSIFGPVHGSGWNIGAPPMGVLSPNGQVAVQCTVKGQAVLSQGIDQCEKIGGKVHAKLKQAYQNSKN